jgi:hypothetical protein
VETPSGRFSTGSIANASIDPSDRTLEALLCASTATTRATPDRISITAVAMPNRPSPATVCTGRWTAPSWSGHVLVEDRGPSRKSSEHATKESTSFRGSTPASSYAARAAANIISL